MKNLEEISNEDLAFIPFKRYTLIGERNYTLINRDYNERSTASLLEFFKPGQSWQAIEIGGYTSYANEDEKRMMSLLKEFMPGQEHHFLKKY